MFSKKTANGTRAAWLLTAVCIPAIALSGGCRWAAVLPAAACGLIGFCVLRLCGENLPASRPVCLLQWVWLSVYLGSIAARSADSWEHGDTYPVIPGILLLLAAFSARSGAKKAANAGAILFWPAALILGIVFGAGTSGLKAEWMAPAWGAPDPELLPLLLLPCLAVFLPGGGARGVAWLPLAAAAVAAAAALWIGGSLSPSVAEEARSPLIFYSKSISLFGVAERFEAVISCVLTVGWFAMFSLVLSTAGTMADRLRPGLGQWGVWICAGLALAQMLLPLEVPPLFSAAVSLTLWAAVPLMETAVKLCRQKGERSRQ